MPDRTVTLWEWIDRHEGALVDRLGALVRAAGAGEAAVQQCVGEMLRAYGCSIESFSYEPRALAMRHEFAAREQIDPEARTVVVGRLAGSGGGRSLLCFAHPDGEPLTRTERWRRPLFDGIVEQGRIYGWGVGDDLLGVATMAAALEALAGAGVRLRGDLLIASTPSKRRAQGIIATLDRGYLADGCLYLHPAESGVGLDEIKALASGVLRFRITIAGRLPDTTEPGHTAFAHTAINPIDKAWIVYQALMQLDAERGRTVHHPLLDTAIGRSTNLLVASIHGGEEGRLGRIGTSCSLAGTLTFPPHEPMAAVQAQVEQALVQAAEADEWLRENPPALEWLSGTGGVEVPADHPLYQVVSRAIARATGRTPHVNPLHSGSDIRNPLLHAGIPTLGIGSLAGDLSQNGGHDEWADVADYLLAVKATAAIMADWCGVAGEEG
jgi:acetylornithine deacetylase